MKPDSIQQKKKPKVEGALVKFAASVFYFRLIEAGLRRYVGVPELLGMLIGSTVLLAAYWVPPKPELSFFRYAAIIAALVGAFAIELSIPDLLRRYMPVQLAVSLPLLVMSLPLYYMLLKLAPDLERRVGLVRWALVSFVFAMILAGVATIFPSAS